MKQILLMLLLFVANNLTAQTVPDQNITAIPAKTNELGIAIENSMYGNADNYQSAIGVQYKRWKSEHFGLRLSALYRQTATEGPVYKMATSADTFVEQKYIQRIDMATIGAGVEAQRQFYKRVYFYASVDLRIGSGVGGNDTQTIKKYALTQGSTVSFAESITGDFSKRNNVNSLYVGIVPSIGAKIQLKKVCAGIEIVSHFLTYTNTSSQSENISLLDFSLDNFSKRLYIAYRF